MPPESSKNGENRPQPPPSQEQTKGLGDYRAHVPPEIRNVSFPVSVRGYDRKAVEAYVHRVNRVIAELEVSRSPQAAVRHAVDRVTEQTKSILQEARESAEQITATAREEGDQILAAAKAEAAELVVGASSEADRLGAEGDQTLAAARAEAEGLLAGARQEAEQIVADARSDAAETRRRSDEEIAARQAEAEARMRDLQSDTEAVWNERRQLLGDIHGMATRLQDAASAAAARFSPEEPEEPPPSEEMPLEPQPPVDPEAATVIATNDSPEPAADGGPRPARARKPARPRQG